MSTTREEFERAWQRSLDSYTGDPESNTYPDSHQEAGWLMWEASRRERDIEVLRLWNKIVYDAYGAFTGFELPASECEAIADHLANTFPQIVRR